MPPFNYGTRASQFWNIFITFLYYRNNTLSSKFRNVSENDPEFNYRIKFLDVFQNFWTGADTDSTMQL
jgi:hypothetical protein